MPCFHSGFSSHSLFFLLPLPHLSIYWNPILLREDTHRRGHLNGWLVYENMLNRTNEANESIMYVAHKIVKKRRWWGRKKRKRRRGKRWRRQRQLIMSTVQKGFEDIITSARRTENLTAIWQWQLSDPSSNKISHRNESSSMKDIRTRMLPAPQNDKWRQINDNLETEIDKWQGMFPRTLFYSCGHRICNLKVHPLSTYPSPVTHCTQHKTLGHSPSQPPIHTLERTAHRTPSLWAYVTAGVGTPNIPRAGNSHFCLSSCTLS